MERAPYVDGAGQAGFPGGYRSGPEAPGRFDWFGYWVRFASSALFGAIASIRLLLAPYQGIGSMMIWMIATILFCALASGLAGDKFWRSIGSWFRWW